MPNRMRVLLSATGRSGRFFLFTFLLFALPAFAQNEEKIRAVEAYIQQQMQAQQMPGISVAVMHGDFRWSRGFGFADVDNEVPARADSSYRMGSVTKPMTAVAILELADEGKIDLDAEIQTYVPYFPRKSKPITVRQLLAHQGGISHYKDYEKEGHIREPKTTREAIAIFENWDLIAEPGTSYNYTSYGYNLLGAAIEGASGKPYAEYMTENVWKPLGMTSTRMDDPRALIPHRVTGYTLEKGQLRRSEYIDVSSRFGGGGTRSTVEDMIRLVEGLAAGKVLKESTRDLAWTATPTKSGRYTNYGLGFGIDMSNGRWKVAHSGAQQETRTDLVIAPGEHFAVALATNFEDAELDPIEQKILEIFLGDPVLADARANDDATQSAWRAMNDAYRFGLGYYDRHGKPMTTDARELANAFAYFKRAQTNATLAADGAHPVSGEMLTKLGSYMASVLASSKRDLDVYHREGPLRFFADYAAASPQRNFDRAFTRNLTTWLADWNRVWTAEMRDLDATSDAGIAALERNRAALAAASLKPDYSRALGYVAEQKVRAGDIDAAMRVANLGYALYPRSARMNALLGVLTSMKGDAARAKSLLAASLAIDPRDFASAGNLLSMANFLARGSKPSAIALLEVAAELHPNDAALRARLEELRR